MGKFFEDLGKKAESLFSKAQTAVENGCERFQLSQDIQAQKLAVNDLFAELGRLTYHGNAELAGVRPKPEITADIAAAAAKLAALEEQYEEITAPQEEPDIDLQPEAEEQVPTANCFCHKCGTPQPKENDFCHKCGTKLNK